jgi:hypothetical protein
LIARQNTYFFGVAVIFTVTVLLNACGYALMEEDKSENNKQTGPTNNPPTVPYDIIYPPTPNSTDDLQAVTAGDRDMDGDSLSYRFEWSKNGAIIPGQSAVLLSANQYTRGDIIVLRMVVTDGHHTVERISTVTIANSPPVIETADNMTIHLGEEMTLNATISDPESDSFVYSWNILSQPHNSNAVIVSEDTLITTVDDIEQGEYRISLSATDGQDESQITIIVTVAPMPLFNLYAEIDGPTATEAIAIGDLNSDGLNDVVVTTSSSINPENASNVFVYLQDLAGNLGTPIKYNAGLDSTHYQIDSVAIADMNNDGMNDVVITQETGIGLFLQNTQGTLDPITVYNSNQLYFSNSEKLVAADFDGDGLSDVAAIDWGNQSEGIDIYIQNDNGLLDATVTYAAPHSGWPDLTYGDLNNDGLNDIVVMSGTLNEDNFLILTQQEDNTFGTAIPYNLNLEIAESPRSIAVGDTNGDSLDDLVVAYGGNIPFSNIAIYYQNSGGTLEPPIHLPTHDLPSALDVADINSDGRKDIIVSHGGHHIMSIYLQNADGTLMPEQRYPFIYSNSNPHRMAVGDINGDGQSDIVEADGSGITVLYHQ